MYRTSEAEASGEIHSTHTELSPNLEYHPLPPLSPSCIGDSTPVASDEEEEDKPSHDHSVGNTQGVGVDHTVVNTLLERQQEAVLVLESAAGANVETAFFGDGGVESNCSSPHPPLPVSSPHPPLPVSSPHPPLPVGSPPARPQGCSSVADAAWQLQPQPQPKRVPHPVAGLSSPSTSRRRVAFHKLPQSGEWGVWPVGGDCYH